MPVLLYGFGLPLLDILSKVNLDLLKKYDLNENDAILAEEKHMLLFEELVNNYHVQYIPGGAAQNTIKVAQWILQTKYACAFSGCVKNDVYGNILKESSEKLGIRTLYLYNEGPESTGVCAVLVSGHNRSLVTNLGSSRIFSEDFLDKSEVRPSFQEAKMFYISSFFIVASHETVMKVAKHSVENDKIFCLNLSAKYMVHLYNRQVTEAIEYCDYVFGNEAEALQLAETSEFDTRLVGEIAQRVSALPSKKQGGANRTVVITQGPNPVIVAHGGNVTQFPVPALVPEAIIDTTGAGDAFVGGFLAQLLNGRGVDECVRCGIWAAQVVIQRLGCTFPDECLFS